MGSWAQAIRDRLARGETVHMPGVYDALTARLAAEAGFDVLFVSGYSVSASRLGMPDFGYLTQTEMADAARAVCGATDRPVIVDADTGYGNPLNAIRTAHALNQAGAAGIFLEDQQWPKKCGHFAGKRVIERDEWLAKLRAVLDQRAEGVDLFLVARTDARAAHSLGDAIDRARAARDLGVDAIFVEAPESVTELEQVADKVDGVVRVANMIEGGRTPLLTPSELHDLGYDLVVTPLSALFAATRGVRDALAVLKQEGSLRHRPDLLVAFADFEPVVDLDHHRRLEERFRS
ncbi:MAG TPA: isocitrate lyase/PEP mutase family protein [Egibacteraceae bacterium]|nr:isocitrate lyase/PEP mutase family protein [Actinomycetota bacterium]HWB73205.1 isocitrate lyase/PEP mutase family protein [Egibacteraceae bacterium]